MNGKSTPKYSGIREAASPAESVACGIMEESSPGSGALKVE
jgi:hypothetical protein